MCRRSYPHYPTRCAYSQRHVELADLAMPIIKPDGSLLASDCDGLECYFARMYENPTATCSHSLSNRILRRQQKPISNLHTAGETVQHGAATFVIIP